MIQRWVSLTAHPPVVHSFAALFSPYFPLLPSLLFPLPSFTIDPSVFFSLVSFAQHIYSSSSVLLFLPPTLFFCHPLLLLPLSLPISLSASFTLSYSSSSSPVMQHSSLFDLGGKLTSHFATHTDERCQAKCKKHNQLLLFVLKHSTVGVKFQPLPGCPLCFEESRIHSLWYFWVGTWDGWINSSRSCKCCPGRQSKWFKQQTASPRTSITSACWKKNNHQINMTFCHNLTWSPTALLAFMLLYDRKTEMCWMGLRSGLSGGQ